MRFYTGQGDNGQTALFGSGDRIPKTDPRFEALGALDELNSYLGVCKSLADGDNIKSALENAQENLFIIQAELGGAKNMALAEDKTKNLEKTIDEFGGFVGQITKFTIPGGNPLSARLDYARALARKAERRVASVKEKISPASLAYVNKKTGVAEVHPRYALTAAPTL